MILSSEQIQEAESLIEAIEYLYLFYREQLLPESQLQERVGEVFRDYRRERTYWQTEDELTYGAKVAWRNSTRCIGRLLWQSLIVRDLRHLTTAADIFAALVEHIQQATNGGSIRSMMSIFAPDSPGQPGIRIWNSQLIRYAGLSPTRWIGFRRSRASRTDRTAAKDGLGGRCRNAIRSATAGDPNAGTKTAKSLSCRQRLSWRCR